MANWSAPSTPSFQRRYVSRSRSRRCRPAGGFYNVKTRTVTVAEALLTEDSRPPAVGLVHELRHAADLDQVVGGLRSRDCLDWEARAFEAQAIVARAFWPHQLPEATDWERGISMTVRMYEQGGIDAIRAWLEQNQEYERMCAPWSA
jgi:hypothetical protein